MSADWTSTGRFRRRHVESVLGSRLAATRQQQTWRIGLTAVTVENGALAFVQELKIVDNDRTKQVAAW